MDVVRHEGEKVDRIQEHAATLGSAPAPAHPRKHTDPRDESEYSSSSLVLSLDVMDPLTRHALIGTTACAAGVMWGLLPTFGGAGPALTIAVSVLPIALTGTSVRLAHRILVALGIVLLAGVVAALRSALIDGGIAVDETLLAVINASWALAALIAVHAAWILILRRGEHRRRGWRLADALASEQAAVLRASIAEERAEVAGEIHDGIGHRLAFATLSLGRLGTRTDLDPPTRAQLGDIREDLADITEDLGRTVQLLRRGDAARRPAGRSLEDAVTELQRRAITVRVTGLESAHGSSPHTAAALARVVEEVGANAAKHANGSALTVELQRSGPAIVLTASTAAQVRAHAAGSSGNGLASLAQRLDLLGGRLDHTPLDQDADSFVVHAQIPFDAVAQPREGAAVPDIAAAQERSRREVRHGLGRAAVTALTLGLIAAITAPAVFAVHNQLGVLPPEQFARLHVGQPADEARAILPPVQMLEAPVREAPQEWDCRYYEERVSWFERTDVFRVCLDDAAVVEIERIPA